MTVNELIEKLNRYCAENEVYDVEDIGGDMWEELKRLNFQSVTTVDSDEHRWYVLGLGVYSVTIDGAEFYIGTWEVETVKSERMSVSDCENLIKFFEMEKYATVSYHRKGEPRNA